MRTALGDQRLLREDVAAHVVLASWCEAKIDAQLRVAAGKIDHITRRGVAESELPMAQVQKIGGGEDCATLNRRTMMLARSAAWGK